MKLNHQYAKSHAELKHELYFIFKTLVGPDRSFLLSGLLYGVFISLLTLAVPVSVQVLINSIIYTASLKAVSVLAISLFLLLCGYGVLTSIQTYLLELFERRVYARICAEFCLRTIYARYQYFKSINRHELINRYFEIMAVQKIFPSMITGLFALVLQMIVGIVLVSFYHPWLFVFNMCFLFVLWIIWRVWSGPALQTAVTLSQSKYETARYLEDIAQANSFYKSAKHADFGIDKTESYIDQYIQHKKIHFGFTFRQSIALLILYAVASSLLLGLGGYLVISDQLTIGQLVAAELILSAVFYGVSRISYYLKDLYSIAASLEEMYLLLQVPLEKLNEEEVSLSEAEQAGNVIEYRDASYVDDFEQDSLYQFNFIIERSSQMLAYVSDDKIKKAIVSSLKAYILPSQGQLLFKGRNVADWPPHKLRDCITVLDRVTLPEGSIEEYFRLVKRDVSVTEINQALDWVKLLKVINQLPEKLSTHLTSMGHPLSTEQLLRLKLAAACLAKPDLLVLTEVYDLLPAALRYNILDGLSATHGFACLFITNNPQDNQFGKNFAHFTPSQQVFYHDRKAFLDAVEQGGW